MTQDSEPERWWSHQVAEYLGVAVATVWRYHSTGAIPTADGYEGTRPWWRPETIRRHKAGQADRIAAGRARAALTRSFYPQPIRPRRTSAPAGG